MARELQKKETKKKILQASKKLFLYKSINLVKTEEIAKDAGVSKGSVFHHFENKEALVAAVMMDLFNDFLIEFKKVQNLIENDPTNWEKYFRDELTLIFSIEQENPNIMKFFLDYLSTYPIDLKQPGSTVMKLLRSMEEYILLFAKIFHSIGITKGVQQKTMILFAALDGLILQIELIPEEQKYTIKPLMASLIDEVIDIIRFWKQKE